MALVRSRRAGSARGNAQRALTARAFASAVGLHIQAAAPGHFQYGLSRPDLEHDPVGQKRDGSDATGCGRSPPAGVICRHADLPDLPDLHAWRALHALHAFPPKLAAPVGWV
jgi:hypothetical protein